MKSQLPILIVGLMVCSALLAAGCYQPAKPANAAGAPYDPSYYEGTPYINYVPYDDNYMPGYYYGQGYPGYYDHHFYAHRESMYGGGQGQQRGGQPGEHH
jgi:hypothetical protein